MRKKKYSGNKFETDKLDGIDETPIEIVKVVQPSYLSLFIIIYALHFVIIFKYLLKLDKHYRVYIITLL
jgi:hypothetical protein